MDTYTSLPDQIRAAMAALGIGVVQLSEKLGFSGHSHLSRILSGAHDPRPELLRQLATALGTTLVRHEVYTPAVRAGDEKRHLGPVPVTKNVTGASAAKQHGISAGRRAADAPATEGR